MAFSPECPKGGFPMSCARAAAATIAPKSLAWYPWMVCRCGYFSISFAPTFLPSVLPTTLTSKLWVSLVCTKSVWDKGMTWVLSCKLLNSEEKIILS